MRQACPASDGTYRFVGLPAGEYIVSVVTDVKPDQLADIDFLQMLSTSSFRIARGDGEKQSRDLKLGGN